MLGFYLSFRGQAREAAAYYARVFQAPAPYILGMDGLPQGAPEGEEDLVAYASIPTFAGNLMLSDDMPGVDGGANKAAWLVLAHTDTVKIKEVFEALAQDGQVLLPLAPTFFNPLYGLLVDRYGYHWMVMADLEDPQHNEEGGR